jgi:hypothetical protein
MPPLLGHFSGAFSQVLGVSGEWVEKKLPVVHQPS